MHTGSETHRRKLQSQAHQIARREARRKPPLVALLTGSAAWGALSNRSDIDVIFVCSQSDGVSYRYYLPELTGVDTRTEIGRIPLAYLERVLKCGYSDEISTGLREQLRNARILLGDQDLGGRLIRGFAELKPKKKLLGNYMHQAGQARQKAGDALPAGRRVEFILSADDLARNLWRLILVAKHRVGVQKEKHEIRAARQELNQPDLVSYLRTRRIADADRCRADSVLRWGRMFISRALALVRVEPKILGETPGLE
jgi:predicted nucleotidyltransferase